MKCAYFAVTWEPQTPKACKLFGFKTRLLPSEVVRSSTGEECVGFVKKNIAKK